MKVLKFVTEFVRGWVSRWVDMFFEGTSRMAESIFAMILILWGTYLLLPSWVRHSDIYQNIYQRITADIISGSFMLGVGVAFMVAILWQSAAWRSRGCILACCVFTGLFWIYYAAGRASVGLVILPFYSFSCALLYLRPHLITYFRNRLFDAAEREINGKPGGDTDGRGNGGRRTWSSHKSC